MHPACLLQANILLECFMWSWAWATDNRQINHLLSSQNRLTPPWNDQCSWKINTQLCPQYICNYLLKYSVPKHATEQWIRTSVRRVGMNAFQTTGPEAEISFWGQYCKPGWNAAFHINRSGLHGNGIQANTPSNLSQLADKETVGVCHQDSPSSGDR